MSEGGEHRVAANEQLRAARERVESLSCLGECVSRQELAELVNAWIWRHEQKVVQLDDNYVGKSERGVIRWPSARYRAALRAVLGVSTDSALGFRNPRRAVVQHNVDRQQFLRGAALGVGALALGPVSAMLDGGEPTPTPSRVGSAEIEQIQTAAHVFASWDHTYGGGLAREAVLAQLRWSAGLLEAATCRSSVRHRLQSAVGYLAHTCAFMAFDAYAHADARRIFQFALGCANDAHDWHLRAKVLSSMARQSIWTGQPDEGLTLTEHALVRADRLTATESAMLHTAHARALAKMGRVRETLAAVGRADDHFARRDPSSDPTWMGYYDAAQHVGDTGHALYDLAMMGQSAREARSRLADAVDKHAAPCARSRAISQIKLASLLMVHGDPAEAAATGTQALRSAGNIRSRRAADDLRELARHTARHLRHDDVAALRHEIAHVLQPT